MANALDQLTGHDLGAWRVPGAMVLVVALGTTGCSDDDPDPTEPAPPESVSIQGTVADSESGESIAGASVTGTAEASGDELFQATTGDQGDYEAEFEVADEPDQVRVTAAADEYDPLEVVTDFRESMSVDLELAPEPYADVALEDASVEPTMTRTGETVTVTASVRNHGTAVGEKDLTFYVDGAEEEETSVSVDPPGEGEEPEDTEVDAEFTWSTYDAGDYEMAVNEEEAGTVTIVTGNELEGYERVAGPTRLLSHEQFQRDVVECPAGTVPYSGGVRSGDHHPGLRVHYSGPAEISGEPTAWVTGYSNQGHQEVSLQARALCAEPLDDYQVSSGASSMTVEAGEFEELARTCPRETVPISGGARVVGSGEDETETRVQYSQPGSVMGQDAWKVGMLNQGDEDLEFTVYSVCAEPPAGYQAVENDRQIAGNTSETVFARCGENREVLGGGVGVLNQGEEEPQTRVQTTGPGSSSGFTEWVTAIHNGRSEVQDLRAHAICAAY